MGAKHILKYHLLLPVGIAGALLLFGASLSTAVVVGMMTGCMGMMLAMASDSSSDDAEVVGTEQDHAARHHHHH